MSEIDTSQTRYPYHINIYFDPEDGDYIADVPDFKYVSAFGDSPQDALREVLIALALAVSVLEEDGLPLPEPRYKPEYLR